MIIFLSFIGFIIFGGIVRHHYLGGKKFQKLKIIPIFLVELPSSLKKMFENKSINPSKPPILKRHKDKERFKIFTENKRNALLILPRYDHSLNRSIIDIIDLLDFSVIHSYKSDINELNNIFKNDKKFSNLEIDFPPIRFLYQHPLLLDDGSIIVQSNDYPVFRIDICSNLIWFNTDEISHHSLMKDSDGNIWTGGTMNMKSKYVKKYQIKDYEDDSIIKFDKNGKILFNKSVTEILIENKIVPDNFVLNSYLSNEKDPIHLNDIEPAINDTEFWKQGDLFLSLREQSSVVHYRPSTNKIINYITGPFAWQHDIDIVSDKEISIFNNNEFIVNNEYSEILIYNFETKKFRKLFNAQLQKENFKTSTQGLSHIFNDGALLVEEQNHGRIILFDKTGEKEFEFVNKDKNDNIGYISWSRIIEDDMFIKKFKSLIINKKCKS